MICYFSAYFQNLEAAVKIHPSYFRPNIFLFKNAEDHQILYWSYNLHNTILNCIFAIRKTDTLYKNMRNSIYILDNHPIIAEGLKHLLEKENRYQICTGNRPPELYNYLNSQPCDLLIIDYELDNQTALDILSYLRKKSIHIPVVVYTMHTEFWIIKLLIKAEVNGIVIKNDKTDEITKAVESILIDQNKYYSHTALNIILSIMGDQSVSDSITYVPSPRENEVINMLSCGLTSDEIAQKLNLSKNTIDTIRKNILLKSGATNVSHLMRIAFIKGWIKK